MGIGPGPAVVAQPDADPWVTVCPLTSKDRDMRARANERTPADGRREAARNRRGSIEESPRTQTGFARVLEAGQKSSGQIPRVECKPESMPRKDGESMEWVRIVYELNLYR